MALNTTNFPPDLIITNLRGGNSLNSRFTTRLIGNASVACLTSSSTAAQAAAGANSPAFVNNVAYEQNTGSSTTGNFVGYAFRRAPGFFDVVCYTGGQSQYSHNLGVEPELIITKSRNNSYNWGVYSKELGLSKLLYINSNAASLDVSNYWGSTGAPTSTLFNRGVNGLVNNVSGINYVAYLFASCPGVSKVFSFTGNGTNQTINCGFTNGARFVMLKRTDSTGDWFVWDTARGIVAGSDPHLSLNTTAAEVTSNDTIDPDSSGFIVNQVAATNVNVNGATYIGIAIA